MEMNSVLQEWLREEFYNSNIPKYIKYFEEWLINITPNQIEGFEQQRICKISKSKSI